MRFLLALFIFVIGSTIGYFKGNKMKSKNIGHCRICGKYTQLTFEHIPPRDALNNYPARMYSGDELLKKYRGEPGRYRNQQKGMGGYTLCSSCNNNTGQWYAPAYNLAARATAAMLLKEPPQQHGVFYVMDTKEFEPLAFVKQVVAMFCSNLSFTVVKQLGFDKLLLNKENNTVDKNLFDLRIYLTSQEGGRVQLGGPFVALYADKETGQLTTNQVAELGVYPFGFILNLTPENPIKYGLSIMEMFDTEYGKKYPAHLTFQYLERASNDMPLPLQYKPLPEYKE